MKKLAVFFPGIGYTNDKPLLYYSRKIAKAKGFEELCIEYQDMPKKVMGDPEMMKKAYETAYKQVEEQLNQVNFKSYEDVLFVGKSIGTVVASQYVKRNKVKVRMVLYTPLEETFSVKIEDAIAFIGTKDPWSIVTNLVIDASEQNIPLMQYPECNHSLESGNVTADLMTLMAVMNKTEEYMSR